MSAFAAKLTSLMGSGLVESAAQVADRFIQTTDEKAKFKLEFEKLLQQRDGELEQTVRAELGAKERIMVAELQQSDRYTKRARPTVIYMGLFIIAFNYCLVPLLQYFGGNEAAPFLLPAEFWLAWGGAVSIYSVGRTMEKSGATNRFSKIAAGEIRDPSLPPSSFYK